MTVLKTILVKMKSHKDWKAALKLFWPHYGDVPVYRKKLKSTARESMVIAGNLRVQLTLFQSIGQIIPTTLLLLALPDLNIYIQLC